MPSTEVARAPLEQGPQVNAAAAGALPPREAAGVLDSAEQFRAQQRAALADVGADVRQWRASLQAAQLTARS